MPTYEYRCDDCSHQFEQFQSITEKPLVKCPKCGKRRLHRLIGAGAGVIFKGSGFYQTDYRSESYKKAAEAETKPAKTEASEDKGKKSTTSEAPASSSKPAAEAKAKKPKNKS